MISCKNRKGGQRQPKVRRSLTHWDRFWYWQGLEVHICVFLAPDMQHLAHSTWHVLVDLNWTSESGCQEKHQSLMEPELPIPCLEDHPEGPKAGRQHLLGRKWVPRVDIMVPPWLVCPLMGTMSHLPTPSTSQMFSSPWLALKSALWGMSHLDSHPIAWTSLSHSWLLLLAH